MGESIFVCGGGRCHLPRWYRKGLLLVDDLTSAVKFAYKIVQMSKPWNIIIKHTTAGTADFEHRSM